MDDSSSLFVRSLAKGLKVLEVFANADQGLSLGDVAKLTGLDKSAAQRSVHTLVAAGYLEKDPRSGRLGLGTKVLDLSFYFLRTNPLVTEATPVLLQLRKDCGERTNLSLFDGESIIYAIRLQGRTEYPQYSTLVGRRMPSYCSAGGRAALARLSDVQAQDIIARSDRRQLTPHTLIEADAIFEKVLEARAKGYALAVEESSPNELVVAAAVLDATGQPVASIHIAGSMSNWKVDEFEAQFGRRVVETAALLSRSRGTLHGSAEA